MSDLFSENDQNKENAGLRRFLVLEADSFSDLLKQATGYAELLHPGIAGSARFTAGLPTLLASLAGAIGQMGHWDEHMLMIFIRQCMSKWCAQLFLYPHGGTFKVGLRSQELLQSRPYKGTTKQFRLMHMPPHTCLLALRGTAHGGACWGALLRMFVNMMVENLRIARTMREPSPLFGIGPDQLVEARIYLGLISRSTPQSDEYPGGLSLTNDFKPEGSISTADDELVTSAFPPIFQLEGETPTCLLSQSATRSKHSRTSQTRQP